MSGLHLHSRRGTTAEHPGQGTAYRDGANLARNCGAAKRIFGRPPGSKSPGGLRIGGAGGSAVALPSGPCPQAEKKPGRLASNKTKRPSGMPPGLGSSAVPPLQKKRGPGPVQPAEDVRINLLRPRNLRLEAVFSVGSTLFHAICTVSAELNT